MLCPRLRRHFKAHNKLSCEPHVSCPQFLPEEFEAHFLKRILCNSALLGIEGTARAGTSSRLLTLIVRCIRNVLLDNLRPESGTHLQHGRYAPERFSQGHYT